MNWYAPIVYLNRLSDRVEKRLPRWLQYNYVGDPVSWYFSHPAWALIGAAIGAAIHGRPGAVAGAAVVTAIYGLVREPKEARKGYRRWGWAGAWKRLDRNPYTSGIQVGWLADYLGDVGGPALATALLWLALR